MPDAFAAASTYQRIADGGMNIGLVLGKSFPAEEMRNRDLAGTHVAHGEVGVEGSGAAVLGDPVNSLCFLANALGRTGGSLAAVWPDGFSARAGLVFGLRGANVSANESGRDIR